MRMELDGHSCHYIQYQTAHIVETYCMNKGGAKWTADRHSCFLFPITLACWAVMIEAAISASFLLSARSCEEFS